MIHHTIAVLLLLSGQQGTEQPVAQQSDAEAVRDLRTSAQRQLDRCIAQLNELRDRIAAEKLPLAQRITTLEEQLAEERRLNGDVSRRVDTGNLEIVGLQTEQKLHQDELTYIGDRLEEYVRSFETKIHVSELQYCGQAIVDAKQAYADNTLPAGERFAKQVEFTKTTAKRLSEAVGGMRFRGAGVDPVGDVVEGQFTLMGPVALFSGQGTAGVVVPQAGSDKPLIRPLEGSVQEGLRDVAQGRDGQVPVDPSGGGALEALLRRTSLVHIFVKGGPIMWPLLAASVLALGTVLERLLFLAIERRRRDPRARDFVFASIERGDLAAAIDVGRQTKDFVLRAMGYALEHRDRSLSNALMLAQARELKRFRRGIPVLDTVITLAPLLGLLGTVTGMMGSFSIIGGDLGSPGAITGGIAEALIATAFGLGIAITALLPFNFLNARLEEVAGEIEAASKQLELLVHPGAPVFEHKPAVPLAVGG